MTPGELIIDSQLRLMSGDGVQEIRQTPSLVDSSLGLLAVAVRQMNIKLPGLHRNHPMALALHEQ